MAFVPLLAISILAILPHAAHCGDTIPSTRTGSIAAGLVAPTSVALDADGNIYVSESSRNRLLVYSSSGQYLKKLERLAKPAGVAVDGSGRIYVCNAGSRSVSVYNSGLLLLRKLGAGNGEFQLPVAVAIGNAGNIHVADAKGDKVKVYRPDGTLRFAFGTHGNDDGNFNFPTSIAIDAATGDVVVSDLQATEVGVKGARIQVFDANGAFKRKFGSYGRGAGLLMKPLGTAIDADGRIYVSDSYQNIVHVYDANGDYRTTVYDLAHPMRTPLGIAINGKTGRLYVASLNTSTVEIYGDGAAGSGVNAMGQGSLSFSTFGGGGCSMAGTSARGSVSPAGCLLPLVALLLLLRVGNRMGTKRRTDPRMKRP